MFVTKTVVKVIHEHESSGSVRTVVVREEDDNDRPTVQVINCFSLCINQQISVANSKGVIIGAPITITNIQQTNNIITNINSINSQNTIYNNAINSAYVSNANTNLVSSPNVNNPPPPPEYSASAPAAISTAPIPVVTSNPTSPNSGPQEITTSGWNCHSPNYNGTCPLSSPASPNGGNVSMTGLWLRWSILATSVTETPEAASMHLTTHRLRQINLHRIQMHLRVLHLTAMGMATLQ